MKHLLCYGTLRKNQANFNRFGCQRYIKTLWLKGYDIYGPFPIAVKGTGYIIVELHEITKQADEYIRLMEVQCGYEEVKLKIDDVIASLYIRRGKPHGLKKLKSGDWVKECGVK